MHLPGTPNERIGDLRTRMGISQKQLAEQIGIVSSQLSRIETGEIKNIGLDVLIKLAQVFNVSTDYILGLTTVSVPKSYDISELGISEGSVKVMLGMQKEMPIINRLLEHKRFPYLVQVMKSYFVDSTAMGAMGLNSIMDIATSTLGDFVKENPEHKKEAFEQRRLMQSQKMGSHDAEIEKLKSVFLGIMVDIKKEIGEERSTGTVATATFIRDVQQEIINLPPDKRTPEDAADALVRMVEKAVSLDDQAKEMYRQLVSGLFKGAGTRTSIATNNVPEND